MSDNVLIFAVILTIFSIILAILIYLYHNEKALRKGLDQKLKNTYRIAQNQVKGDVAQLIGTFSVLSEYDEISTLSSTSKQGSLDLLAMKDDHIDFIEFKKKGAKLTTNENRLKKLILTGRVTLRYRIVDVEIPESIAISERETVATDTMVVTEDGKN